MCFQHGLGGTVYQVDHPYLRQAYMLSEDFLRWAEILDELKHACRGKFLAIGGTLVVFEQLDDAMLFRLRHDGEIAKVDLGEASSGEKSLQ